MTLLMKLIKKIRSFAGDGSLTERFPGKDNAFERSCPKAEVGRLEPFTEEERETIREVLNIANIQTLSDEEIKSLIQQHGGQQNREVEKPEKLVRVIKDLAGVASGLTLEIPRITIQPKLLESSCYRQFPLNLKGYTPSTQSGKIL